jgi:hypothetical protein
MAMAGCLGHQGGADHLDGVSAPQQRILGQQHVGPPAATAAGASGTTAFLEPTVAHDPLSGTAPGPQSAVTVGTCELTGQQGALDFRRVGSYDLHVCLRALGRALPSLG